MKNFKIKKLKKIIIVVIALCVLFAMPAMSGAAENYTVDSMDVNIVINDNNSYDITETVEQNYTVPSHGMYRTFNLNPTIWSTVGGEAVSNDYHVYISNVNVDNTFETDTQDGSYMIRIGDADKYVDGKHTDTISYNYYLGEDKLVGIDEFNHNIAGGLDILVPISNVSFSIQFPHDFDTSKIGFSTGKAGFDGYDQSKLSFEVNGRQVSGRYNGTLQPGETITMRVELPQGYYTSVEKAIDTANPALIAICVIFALVIILFVFKRNKKKPVETVEFYPPEGMTSADVGYIIDGVVEDRDVISLLIYWADKGYLEIHEAAHKEGEKKKHGKDVMIFKKLAELPDSANSYESAMFDGLFEGVDEVSTKSLENNFYKTIQVVKARLKTKFDEKDNRVFCKKSIALKNFMQVLAALPMAIMTGVVVYVNTREVFFVIFSSLIAFLFGWIIIASYSSLVDSWQSEKKSNKVWGGVLWAVLSTAFYLIVVLLSGDIFGQLFIIPPVLQLIMTFIVPFFKKRTDNGLLWYGRILGLKNFIEKVELEKLKMLVLENPAYFYNVMPYAYVLGLSDKWAKQFESIAIEPPSWYYGGGWSTFSTIYFTTSIMRAMTYTQNSLATSSAKDINIGGGSGGGGFSGGGFSGGGSGGGGMGSW